LPIGSILDKVGPQKTAILGSLVFLLGNFVFGLQITKGGKLALERGNDPEEELITKLHSAIDTYVIGYVLLALGSPAIFLSQFHRKSNKSAFYRIISR
jgi:hypothetical protein